MNECIFIYFLRYYFILFVNLYLIYYNTFVKNSKYLFKLFNNYKKNYNYF